MSNQFTVTVKRFVEEEYQIVVEAGTVMEAYDNTKQMTDLATKELGNGQYFVTKVEERK